jgi:hypothetical protein
VAVARWRMETATILGPTHLPLTSPFPLSSSHPVVAGGGPRPAARGGGGGGGRPPEIKGGEELRWNGDVRGK